MEITTAYEAVVVGSTPAEDAMQSTSKPSAESICSSGVTVSVPGLYPVRSGFESLGEHLT